MTRAVIMASGGIDSTMAADAHPGAPVVYVDYGQPYAPMEEAAISGLFGDRASVVRMDGLPPLGDDYYVPARNLMLATVGVRYGDEVCFAGMRDEQCPDKSPAAFEAMSEILTAHCKRPVRVFSPFWSMNKADAVRAYLADGGDPGRLRATVSCYDGTWRPCGGCEACFRRWTCLSVNGVEVPRPSDSIIRSYGMRLLHEFTARRRLTVLEAVNSPETPVVLADLADHPSLGTLRNVVRPGGSYLVLHSQLTEKRRQKVVGMLRAEGVSYDSLLMGTGREFFTRRWERRPSRR